MTHDMLLKARANARKLTAKNVEFRLGEERHLLAWLPGAAMRSQHQQRQQATQQGFHPTDPRWS